MVLYLNIIISVSQLYVKQSSYLALLKPGKGSQGVQCMNTDDLIPWSPQSVFIEEKL